MQELSDAQLLRDYAEHGHEAAFRKIVTRHTDVVYSSALRQVGSPDLARDVAQSVFGDLARKAKPLAGELAGNASLLGWLYRSTRFAALTLLRDERRRHAREGQVMEHFNTASEEPPDWDRVSPVLDEAMADLNDEDREALLLRFFKNHDFRAVGAALGVSDDAAQKRVSRALERLRAHITRRGVTTTAVALTTVLSANAATLAPIGLAATLSSTALAGTTTAITATATKVIAMTTLQKTVVTATVAALAGLGIYEARQASQLRDQVQTLQQQQAPLAEQIRELQRERDNATTQLARFQTENEQLKSNSNTTELLRLRAEIARLRADAAEKENDLIESGMAELATRINQTRRWLEQAPAEKIPELDFITIRDWLNYVGSVPQWQGTTNNFKFVLGVLRTSAKQKLAPRMVQALDDHIIATGGRLPNDLSELKPYLASHVENANQQGYKTPQITDAMLQRYELLKVGNLSDLPETEALIAEKAPTQNSQFDAIFRIGAFGYSYEKTHRYGESGSGGAPPPIVAEKLRAFYK